MLFCDLNSFSLCSLSCLISFWSLSFYDLNLVISWFALSRRSIIATWLCDNYKISSFSSSNLVESSLFSAIPISLSFSTLFFCSMNSHNLTEWLSYSLFSFLTFSCRLRSLPSKSSMVASYFSILLSLQKSSNLSST